MAESPKATVKWAGNGFFVATSPGGHAQVLESDHARNAAASPVELLLIALGGCTGIDVVSILEKKRMKVTSYEAVISGERSPDHPKKFLSMHVHHIVGGEGILTQAVARSIELSETKYCSVAASLEPGVKITSSFEILPEPAK